MLTPADIERLEDIFYAEAPYDFVVVFSKRKNKRLNGLCYSGEKMCIIFESISYMDALITVLHELAHSRMHVPKHTDEWEREFIRLLTKYRIPRKAEAFSNHLIGRRVLEYING